MGSQLRIAEFHLKTFWQFVIPAKSAVGGREPGIQKELDYIEPLLDSGSRAVKRRSSGMTALVNCNIVSSGEEIFAELH